jgi:hypothetical protein
MVDLIYPNSNCVEVLSQMYAFKVNECVKVDTADGTISYKQMVVPTNEPNKYDLTGQQFDSPDCSGPDKGEEWSDYLSFIRNTNRVDFNSCNGVEYSEDEFITRRFITNLDELPTLSPDIVSIFEYSSISGCKSLIDPYKISAFMNQSKCAEYDESIWSRGLMCSDINGTSKIIEVSYSDSSCVNQASYSTFESCSFEYAGIAATLSTCPTTSCNNSPTSSPTSTSSPAPVSDEAAVLCAFIAATNINSIYNEWRCDNTDSRCSWNGITCNQDGKIFTINLSYKGISGK